MKSGKIAFGMNAVVAGQKTSMVNADPMLICNSTNGKFTITSPVSKMLMVAPGDYVQFFNNITPIEAAIAERNVDVVSFCEENGLDIETVEAHEAILKEFGMWGIAKGIAQFDSKGKPKMTSERYTKEDKLEFIKTNGAAILEENREVLIERVGKEDATDEELIAAISVDDIDSPEVQAFSGSKTASTSSMTGIGIQVNFTDSSTWNLLKADLEDKNGINRIYSVDLENPIVMSVSNGKETVDVKVYPFDFVEDKTPAKREKKSNGEADAENED